MASSSKSPLEKLSKHVFLNNISSSRKSAGTSIKDFAFNKTRCRILSKCEIVKENNSGIVYWMSRDCRVEDNWSMLFAQRMALKHEVPLHVCFFYKDKSLYPTKRQFNFLLRGLDEVRDELTKFDINFYLMNTTAEYLSTIVETNNIGCVVTDFFPLKSVTKTKNSLLQLLPDDVPLAEVDAHNIVPTWLASDKLEVGARTIRSKITKKLPEYLTDFPQICNHPHKSKPLPLEDSKTWKEAISDGDFDLDVGEVEWAKAGTLESFETLRTFITVRLKDYDSRNDASKNVLSNLSPWLHFGHISAQRCALEVQKYESKYKSQVQSFIEELVVRRELSDNFCHYNDQYDNIKGAAKWAQDTLRLHTEDKRSYLYSKEDFATAKTHDVIWNAAQNQLLKEGKIHGYMRMYWAKKVLEWTKTPEEAIEIAQWLNDTWSLDGSDPNGFVGVMWSICGVHDQGWKEREIFGKIRYMVDYSMRKKFKVDDYCAKYCRVDSDDSEIPRKKAK